MSRHLQAVVANTAVDKINRVLYKAVLLMLAGVVRGGESLFPADGLGLEEDGVSPLEWRMEGDAVVVDPPLA